MAYDLYALLAMSSKYEHSFSEDRYTIEVRRNNLNREIIKARVALQSWVVSEVIEPSTSI